VEITATSGWKCIDFISDLHLHAGDLQTLQVWTRYLEQAPADALFILGDLFEVWVGDDALHEPGSFEAHCAALLRACSARLPVYLLHGNRDFLLGPAFQAYTGVTLLPQPCVLQFAARRIALAHGDSLCLDDLDYQRFRALVRSDAWQKEFLARPLPARRAEARAMRAQSAARNAPLDTLGDVSTPAVLELLDTLHCDTLVHGHTHRPALHPLAQGRERWVLSDWELGATPARADVLRLQRDALGAAVWNRLKP